MANASKEATLACAGGSPHGVHEVLLPMPDPRPEIPARTGFLGFRALLLPFTSDLKVQVSGQKYDNQDALIPSSFGMWFASCSAEIRIRKGRWFWREEGVRRQDGWMPRTQIYALDSSPGSATHHLHDCGQLFHLSESVSSPGIMPTYFILFYLFFRPCHEACGNLSSPTRYWTQTGQSGNSHCLPILLVSIIRLLRG